MITAPTNVGGVHAVHHIAPHPNIRYTSLASTGASATNKRRTFMKKTHLVAPLLVGAMLVPAALSAPSAHAVEPTTTISATSTH